MAAEQGVEVASLVLEETQLQAFGAKEVETAAVAEHPVPTSVQGIGQRPQSWRRVEVARVRLREETCLDLEHSSGYAYRMSGMPECLPGVAASRQQG